MASITRFRGDTRPIQGFARLNGGVLPVTGCTFLLTVDPSKAPTDATANLFSLAGTIVDALTGELEFQITALQADQTPGKYWFDIEMTDATGYIQTIEHDRFVFTQDITKA